VIPLFSQQPDIFISNNEAGNNLMGLFLQVRYVRTQGGVRMETIPTQFYAKEFKKETLEGMKDGGLTVPEAA